MTNQFSKLTYSISLGIVSCLTINVLAQEHQIDPMLEVEKDNCEGTTEVNYRSQNLTSPDGQTTVYIEGILRRVGKKGDEKHGGYCTLTGRQTPALTLIIEQFGNKTRKALSSGNGAYRVEMPASFSLDNKYLVTRAETGWDGGYADTFYPIYDTKNNYTMLKFLACKDSYGGGYYLGFISPSEILFDCGEFSNYRYEVINIPKKSIRKVSESFAKSVRKTKLYGAVSGEMTILKRQTFPRRE